MAMDLAIPDRGAPVTAEMLGQLEQRAATVIGKIEDVDTLDEWARKARALEMYLRDKETQGPARGIARRCEARIGQLLGVPKEGRPAIGDNSGHVRSLVAEDDRFAFRMLAHAMNGECALDWNEWRKSRRALVSLVRKRMGLTPEMPPLPEGVFRCIVADPPWRLESTGPDAWGTTDKGDVLPYEQMSVDDIKAMPIDQHAADDAHLYLWTINRYVEQSYDVARSWGFKPSALLVWAKTPRGIGLGDAFRMTTEFILYARRGSLEALTTIPTTWFNWPRGRHSEKPGEFYQMVEAVTPAPHGARDRLDLFARRERDGWTVWGDEVADGK